MADIDGFAEFVAQRSPRLLRTAFLLTHDHGLAEDLVQTAFARAWLAWSRINGDAEPYVRRTMVNTYTSWWRRKWNGETPTESLPESADQLTPERTVDDRDAVWQALGRLPKRQQAVVVLRFYEDLSLHETADILGCSVGTVKSQASKALAKLRVDHTLSEHAHTTKEEARA